MNKIELCDRTKCTQCLACVMKCPKQCITMETSEAGFSIPVSYTHLSSVNVIRYNTLLLNGSVKPLSATLRCGAEGAINDNSITSDGRGMFMIGIEPNGCLKRCV